MMMEEKKQLIFNSPKNFKRGKYILNRFRLSDLLFIVGITVLSVILIVAYLNTFHNNIMLNLIVVLILMIPMLTIYLLFLPMPVFFNVLEFIKTFLFYQSKQKKWKWEGIHQFEEGIEEDETQGQE